MKDSLKLLALLGMLGMVTVTTQAADLGVTPAAEVIAEDGAVTIPYPTPFPPVATCPIPFGIKSFVLDDKIDATSFQSAFISTLTPEQLAVFSDPTKQLVTHFKFSTSDNILWAWTIPLPADAPTIPPADTDFEGTAIAKAVILIDRVYTTCVPRPAILIVGPVLAATPVYGSVVGLPHGLSFSFDPSNESNIDNAANVAVVDAGTLTIVGYVASVTVVPKEHKHRWRRR
jgi:hypothetical protein